MSGAARIVLAACALLLALPCSAQAFNPPDYQRLSWKEYPAPKERSAAERSRLYPQWQADTLQGVELLASDTLSGGSREWGVRWLNLSSSRDCILSLILYSKDGGSYVLRRMQPLPAGQSLSLSIHLEREQLAGRLRLIAWRSNPHESWIDLLAQHPNLDTEPIPGVYEERWIDTQSARQSDHWSTDWPWTAGWGTSLGNPHLLYSNQWPLVSSALDQFSTVHSKDCALYFDGSERMPLSADRPRQWELDWSSELRLHFELPPGSANLRTDLWISGEFEMETPLSFPEEPQQALEVRINGTLVMIERREEAFPFEWQLFGAELSPYIRDGLNELSLRVSPLSSTKWLIDGIDVWER